MPVLADGSSHYISCAMPIISEGDIVGCVVSVIDDKRSDRQSEALNNDVESKLVLTAAGFLGRQIET